MFERYDNFAEKHRFHRIYAIPKGVAFKKEPFISFFLYLPESWYIDDYQRLPKTIGNSFIHCKVSYEL
ncbi:hypothetical protein ANME2D_01067 [Candidatus Methanoperedens nitroreducens]|uniref:Uncharacterized protein n=1 Tax=Candidatus Methanoperedens nitratireducens TaxID=1392998 RepID=A0A062V0G5_9EURY|nr:hypothetical protein ANME2D_01067 [Candidatus Methanoperedens nitroreducens]